MADGQVEVKRTFTVSDLPPSERPRERLQRLGVEALSAQEILALILGRGTKGEPVMLTAQKLLSTFGDLQGIAASSVEELCTVKGIGAAKAGQLKAAFELGRRLDSYPVKDKRTVRSPEDALKEVKARLKGKKKEHFLTILLDTRNHVIGVVPISVGSLDSSLVHPREVFKEALSASAASVIFVHNHPSGDPRPSEDDIKLTQRLVEAGKIMGVEVLDHVIIADSAYASLKGLGTIK
jgi:DNA repair protein RadC